MARNSRVLDSVNLNVLYKDMSSWRSRLLYRMFRPELPYVYCAGRANVSAWLGSRERQAELAEVIADQKGDLERQKREARMALEANARRLAELIGSHILGRSITA